MIDRNPWVKKWIGFSYLYQRWAIFLQ